MVEIGIGYFGDHRLRRNGELIARRTMERQEVCVRKLADDRHVFWLDFGYRFVASDGTISREVMRDYLHLTPQGYQIWAAAMEDELAVLMRDPHPGPASGRE